MRPNLPFLLTASNAILKPGNLLKWKKRLVKDARLLLQLTEAMKIVKFISPLPDVLCLSLPRLRHGRQLTFLSWPNLALNLCTLSFILSLAPPSSSPRESASVFADYLRSHFSVSQPKVLHSRIRGYLYKLCQATCLEEFHSSFFSLAEFPWAASNLSSSTATGPDKVAYPMLKYLPHFDMDFLFQLFNLAWSLHSFPSIWKTTSIIPIHKMEKPVDSPASFRPISLTLCVSKLFEHIILFHLLFFLESNSILSLRQAISALDVLL